MLPSVGVDLQTALLIAAVFVEARRRKAAYQGRDRVEAVEEEGGEEEGGGRRAKEGGERMDGEEVKRMDGEAG